MPVAQNGELEEMLKAFPAWTKHDLLHWRADCCFEKARYFLETGKAGLNMLFRCKRLSMLFIRYFKTNKDVLRFYTV